jgi:hypothetical protein
MKSPSKSIGTSLLRATGTGGRGAEPLQVSGMKPASGPLVASGEGSVVASPGWNRGRAGERSAAQYGVVMSRYGGRGVD